MNLFLKIWEKIKEPKILYVVLFYLLFFLVLTGTILLIIFVEEQTIFHYLLYVISATLLAYVVYTMFYYIPKIKQSIINSMNKHEFSRKLLSSYGYRAVVLGILALIINASYVIFQGIIAILSSSMWYGALTIYFLVLGIMRGSILWTKKKDFNKPYSNRQSSEVKVYFSTGIMLIISTLAFSVIMFLALRENGGFEYAGLMIFVIATYTFYKLTLSIYNLFKIRKVEDLYVKSLKYVSLGESLVAIVALQMAMFHAFSPNMTLGEYQLFNGLTGGAVALVIVLIGVYMIIKARKISKNKNENLLNENCKK